MIHQQSSNIKKYILVKDGKKRTYDYRSNLLEYGLKLNKKGKYVGTWQGVVSSREELNDISCFCIANGLKFISYTENLKRSNNYRQVFYNNNPPIFKDYYICAYCLLPHNKKNITVDHIISIKKARVSKMAKYLMKKMKIENINDNKNLVSACRSCNSKKGAKGGLWIFRGFLGKKHAFIFMMWSLLILLIVAVITVIRYTFLQYSSGL